MGEENERAEAPNWLKELEAKRERRLKARLGHEAGAGAPCLSCEQKCPGLDLHFWRKICKNCKCAKENHDVHDDDIYGWAQFQLLGSKPNKTRKFKMADEKEEIELEWTPKGHDETVHKYLRDLPPELLPVKGSAAAQERKQLLQKQIPVHDIDPNLCHDLTDAELKQMNEYIAHVKQDSVGMGQVIQLQLNKRAMVPEMQTSRIPTQMSNTHLVQLRAAHNTSPLKNRLLMEKLENLRVQDEQKNIRLPTVMPNSPFPTAIDNQNPTFVGNIKSVTYSPANEKQRYDNLRNLPENTNVNVNESNQRPVNANTNQIRNIPMETNTEMNRFAGNLPHYASATFDRYNETRKPKSIGNIRDLAFSTHDPATIDTDEWENKNYYVAKEDPTREIAGKQESTGFMKHLSRNYDPNRFDLTENVRDPTCVKIGAINDITYYPANEMKRADQIMNNDIFESQTPDADAINKLISCHRCKKSFEEDAIVIGIERSDALFHSTCFRCAGCNQNLADLVYFYSKESDDIYCGRDYAKIRGIPRCNACDELIFVKEYCLAENATFHVKHFCCFECDTPLAGQNYLVEDTQPLCLPCYDKIKANTCNTCTKVIKPDETGVILKEVHFHANDECFACKVCVKPLLGSKFLFRSEKLYCSAVCFGMDT